MRIANSPSVATASPVSAASSACVTTTRSKPRAYCSRRCMTPVSAIPARPVAQPTAPASAHRPISASSVPSRPRVAAASGWTQTCGLPMRWAYWMSAGSSSGGVRSGISTTRVMPPARQAAASAENTPASIRPGARWRPLQSITWASTGMAPPMRSMVRSRTTTVSWFAALTNAITTRRRPAGTGSARPGRPCEPRRPSRPAR